MSDESATLPESTEVAQEQPAEASPVPPAVTEPGIEHPAEVAPAQGAVASGAVEPKRKAGRPQGAKDRVPRTRRPAVRVVPIAPASTTANDTHGVVPPQQPRVPTPMPVEEPPPPPLSPRSQLRETAKQMVVLRNLVEADRKAKIHKEFTSNLLPWPIV